MSNVVVCSLFKLFINSIPVTSSFFVLNAASISGKLLRGVFNPKSAHFVHVELENFERHAEVDSYSYHTQWSDSYVFKIGLL